MNMKNPKIQVLRGLAIIAVVFIHNTPSGIYQVFMRPFLNFSVGLFLFLSGLLSNSNKWNPKKRLKKIIIPYCIWTLVYVILNYHSDFMNIPRNFLINLITSKSAPMMYYVFVYCQFTLLIPLIERIANSKYKYVAFIISPIEIICMRLLPIILNFEFNTYISIIRSVSCLGWFSYFYLGYLIGNKKIQINISDTKLVILLIVSVCIQMVEGYWYYTKGVDNCGTQLKLSAIFTGVLFAIICYKFIDNTKTKEIKFLNVFGDASFGIYFSHMAIMRVLGKVPLYSAYFIYPINAIVVCIVSLVFVIVVKRVLGKHSSLLAI